jgi:hypothetical protein
VALLSLDPDCGKGALESRRIRSKGVKPRQRGITFDKRGSYGKKRNKNKSEIPR